MENILPSNDLIDASIKAWKNEDIYEKPEEVLVTVFSNKTNSDFTKVFTKVSILNSVYSTNLYNKDVLAITDWIVANHVKFDSKVKKGDPSAVWDLANNGTTGILFSFATKFCSFSNPQEYPIYDSKVENLLWEYKKIGVFDQVIERSDLYHGYRCEIKNNDLRENRYVVFKELIDELFVYCNLNEEYKYKGLDRFLWRPKTHSKVD